MFGCCLLCECAQALFSNWSRHCISQLQRANFNQFNIILISSSIHARALHVSIFFISFHFCCFYFFFFFALTFKHEMHSNGRTAQQLLELRCHSFAHGYLLFIFSSQLQSMYGLIWLCQINHNRQKKKNNTRRPNEMEQAERVSLRVIATGFFFILMPLLFYLQRNIQYHLKKGKKFNAIEIHSIDFWRK